jgi:predicted N-acetyltransferase YhbS
MARGGESSGWEWEGVPNAAFMVLVLDAYAMMGVSGVAKYGPEFSEVG